ncbi:hypothetical protein BREV_BREV_03471 [Brevundimonas mediterranea]|uniref:Uncharacterized protein n=1 Tax=Brevundimonas mediterranea TaxID=74329 RepID=A0A7Z8Y1J4_9CAUL|nr:hypothetical protein BREV_BREV_03471 [Brevundimonas mediterranea]
MQGHLADQAPVRIGPQHVAAQSGATVAGLQIAAQIAEGPAALGPLGKHPRRIPDLQQVGPADGGLQLGGQLAVLGEALDRSVAASLAVHQPEHHVDGVARGGRAFQMGPRIEFDPCGPGDGEGLAVRMDSEDRIDQFQRQIGPALVDAAGAHADGVAVDGDLALAGPGQDQAFGRDHDPFGRLIGVGLGVQLRRGYGVTGRGGDRHMGQFHIGAEGPADDPLVGVAHVPALLAQGGRLGLQPGVDLARQIEPPAGPGGQGDQHDDEGGVEARTAGSLGRCVGHSNSGVETAIAQGRTTAQGVQALMSTSLAPAARAAASGATPSNSPRWPPLIRI